MSKQPEEMLADLNAAVQRVADESGSKIVRNLVMVEELDSKNKCDYIFIGGINLYAEFRAAGAEVKNNTKPDDNRLHNLVKVRIQDTLLAIMELARSELKKLGVEA